MTRFFLMSLLLVGALVVTDKAHSEERAFYRLNVVNQNNELLVLKIKDRELWVTPGLYEAPTAFEIKQLENLAADYGLEVTAPKLTGQFMVSPAEGKPFQTRWFYTAIAHNDVAKLPKFIDSYQWLALPEAVKRIQANLPHLAFLLQQTQSYPDEVWQAKLQRTTEDDIAGFQIVKGFSVDEN